MFLSPAHAQFFSARGVTQYNTVLKVPNLNTNGKLYGFNGGKEFVTAGHPFKTQEGWKAIDPDQTPKEGHNVKTTALDVGDVLILAEGRTMVINTINATSTAAEHHVYNPMVDGDHTYYANGYLVHNKEIDCF